MILVMVPACQLCFAKQVLFLALSVCLSLHSETEKKLVTNQPEIDQLDRNTCYDKP